MSSGVRFDDVSAYFQRLQQGRSAEEIDEEVLQPLRKEQSDILQGERERLFTLLREALEGRKKENEQYLLDAERVDISSGFKNEIAVAQDRLNQMKSQVDLLTQSVEQKQNNLAEGSKNDTDLVRRLNEFRAILRSTPSELSWINRQELAQWGANICKPRGDACR